MSAEALAEAIALNGVAVDFNKQAFLWGRRYADQPQTVLALIADENANPEPTPLDAVIRDRSERLTGYQDAHHAQRYKKDVERVRQVDAHATEDDSHLAVANSLYRLMAYRTNTKWHACTAMRAFGASWPISLKAITSCASTWPHCC